MEQFLRRRKEQRRSCSHRPLRMLNTLFWHQRADAGDRISEHSRRQRDQFGLCGERNTGGGRRRLPSLFQLDTRAAGQLFDYGSRDGRPGADRNFRRGNNSSGQSGDDSTDRDHFHRATKRSAIDLTERDDHRHGERQRGSGKCRSGVEQRPAPNRQRLDDLDGAGFISSRAERNSSLQRGHGRKRFAERNTFTDLRRHFDARRTNERTGSSFTRPEWQTASNWPNLHVARQAGVRTGFC